MNSTESSPPDEHGPDEALRHIVERVEKIRDLGPFEIDRHEDGRFRCELQKPLRELTADEARQVLSTLEALSDAVRRHL